MSPKAAPAPAPAPLKLPATVASQQDLNALIQELREALQWLAHEAVKKKAGATGQSAPPQLSTGASELMQQFGFAADKLEALITQLETLDKKAKVITITLTAEPSNSIKAKLVAWCRTELAPDVLVNFSFNKSLLGGMVVRAGSHVFDWSFRRTIIDNSDKFTEVLRRV